MQYTTEITIDLPRTRVIELFDDPANLTKWQPGLQSFEPLSGTPGQPGARSRLVYEEKGRRMEMIETITSRNLPDEFAGTYEAPGVFNVMHNRFVEDGPHTTRWIADHEFRFSGFMRLAGLFMRGAFPKQTQATMQQFKAFAEAQGAP
jgi:hypothetical protein